MKIRNIASHSDWRKIKQLYKIAFPRYERKPLWIVRMKHRKGEADIWILEHEGEFAGFAITVNELDMVLLDYFAISQDKRNIGLGGTALKALQQMYVGKRFFLEIECIEVKAANNKERIRRKAFYLQNGMTEIGVKANVYTVDMELLGYNCDITFEDYKKLYYASYGNLVNGNIKEIKCFTETE